MSDTTCTCKVVNGTHYDPSCPDSVIRIIEDARLTGTRLRFHWGDAATGEDWCDIYDVTGTVGLSTGPCRVPLLIHNRRSLGGPVISTGSIVKITYTTKPYTWLYKHPNYHVTTLPAPC